MNYAFFDKVSHSLISFKAISNNIQMTDLYQLFDIYDLHY